MDHIYLGSSSDVDDSRSTPPLEEFPKHDAVQLPRKQYIKPKRASFGKLKKSPIDVIEEFIAHLPSSDKESVRASYNGPDWPAKPKPTFRASVTRRTSFAPPNEQQAPGMHFISPPTLVHAPLYVQHPQHNRFLNFTPTSPQGYAFLSNGVPTFGAHGFYQTRGS